jgi:DNA-binding LytR/AlgR family response regulator
LHAIADKSFEVIFVTAYDQYGIQAIKYAALDYLLKPIDIDTKSRSKTLCQKENRAVRVPVTAIDQ